MTDKTKGRIEWVKTDSFYADIVAALCAVAGDFAAELPNKDIHKALKYVAEVWEKFDV